MTRLCRSTGQGYRDLGASHHSGGRPVLLVRRCVLQPARGRHPQPGVRHHQRAGHAERRRLQDRGQSGRAVTVGILSCDIFFT